MLKIILLAASYLFGSIPFGFLIARGAKKIDIRKFGSGNIGATNVFRVVGKKEGVCVFILDLLKGVIPPVAAKAFLPQSPNYVFILAAVLAVCGHSWPCFLRFKGGKGVATSLGAMSGLSFIFSRLGLVLAGALLSWVAVFLIFRYVSLASITASAVFFGLTFVFGQPPEIKVLSFFLLVLILLRHHKNIKRLVNKEENRF